MLLIRYSYLFFFNSIYKDNIFFLNKTKIFKEENDVDLTTPKY